MNTGHSVAELAAITAKNLAKISIHNISLREAIQTEKIPDGVRIGKWEIIVYQDDGALFQIRHLNKDILFTQIAFYDTAHKIVSMLNNGITPRSMQIQQLMDANNQYIRTSLDEWLYSYKIEYYQNLGNNERVSFFENRLGDVSYRSSCLRSLLRSPD